jgi:hypothetical protein
MNVTTVVIPKAFYTDHISRANIGGVIVKETKTQLTIEVTQSAFYDLLSDAKHYAECGVSVYGKDFVGIVRSAQITFDRLKAYEELGLLYKEPTSQKQKVVLQKKLIRYGNFMDQFGNWHKLETEGI